MRLIKTAKAITFVAFLGCTVLLQQSLHAQDAPLEGRPKHIVGLNSTGLLRQFFNLSNTVIPVLPYQLTYDIIGVKGNGVRMGFGLESTSLKQTNSGSTSSLESSSTSFDIRVGYVKQLFIGDTDSKWKFYAGVDGITSILGSQSQSFSNGGNNGAIITSKTNATTIGFGPFMGIRFAFNKRISLGTESSIYMRYFSSKTESDAQFGSGDTGRSGVSISGLYPSTLLLNIHF